MPGRFIAFTRTEYGINVIGEAAGDPKQPLVARGPVHGHSRLEEVPGAIRLVVVIQIRPALVWLVHLVVGVKVPIGLLGGDDQVNRLVRHALHLWVADVGQIVSQGLEPLVDVGIHKHRPLVLPFARACGEPQVVEVARTLQLLVAVPQADLTIDLLLVRPKSFRERNASQGQCMPPRM